MVTENRAPKEVDIYAGEKLKQRRKELGVSQKVLADAVGVTFQQIQKYEKGQNRIGVSRLYDFCKILKVRPSFFFENIEYNQLGESFTYRVAETKEDANEIIELIQNYKLIVDPVKRKIIMEIIKSYIS